MFSPPHPLLYLLYFLVIDSFLVPHFSTPRTAAATPRNQQMGGGGADGGNGTLNGNATLGGAKIPEGGAGIGIGGARSQPMAAAQAWERADAQVCRAHAQHTV